MLDRMTPYERAQVSAGLAGGLRASPDVDPWVHGFSALHRDGGAVVGTGGFKGPSRSCWPITKPALFSQSSKPLIWSTKQVVYCMSMPFKHLEKCTLISKN